MSSPSSPRRMRAATWTLVLATLFGNRFEELMLHELRFAGAMNWLVQLAKRGGGAGDSPGPALCPSPPRRLRGGRGRRSGAG